MLQNRNNKICSKNSEEKNKMFQNGPWKSWIIPTPNSKKSMPADTPSKKFPYDTLFVQLFINNLDFTKFSLKIILLLNTFFGIKLSLNMDIFTVYKLHISRIY